MRYHTQTDRFIFILNSLRRRKQFMKSFHRAFAQQLAAVCALI